MPSFRYKAATVSGESRAGVLTASSAPEARQSLRSAELRVISLRAVTEPRTRRSEGTARDPLRSRWLRSRRGPVKSGFYDGLSTLVRSGLPIRKAFEVLGEGRRLSKNLKQLTDGLASDVRSGQSVEHAFASRPAWFDGLECAVVSAAIRTGDLPSALERLSERGRRSAELRGKLFAALSYPALVLAVAAIVTTVLGTRTLPPIVSMLDDAEITVPRLTEAVMATGEAIASGWPVLVLVGLVVGGGIIAALSGGPNSQLRTPLWMIRQLPSVVVMPQIATLARNIADLTATGVPLAESLRIAEPTLRGVGSWHLRDTVAGIRARLEQGEDLAQAFDDGIWFDPEFHRLLAVGQDAGELPEMLRRLADRNEQQARKSVDRLAALLEPAAILAMSVVVGTVVLAAVLPLIRMQELL
ncbi:MAG: type II secretion system F family protein [Planctomycetota bacterium]